MSEYSALVEIILSQPGMTDRLLRFHVADRLGHCDVCGGRWPCSIRYYADLAAKRRDRESRERP